MPLRVHCPNGCLIRLPNSRSGKVVRCSECKATLRLPEISESEAQSGKPIPMEAKLLAQPPEESETLSNEEAELSSDPSGSPNENTQQAPSEPAVSESPAAEFAVSESPELGLEKEPATSDSLATDKKEFQHSQDSLSKEFVQEKIVQKENALDLMTEIESLKSEPVREQPVIQVNLEAGSGSRTKNSSQNKSSTGEAKKSKSPSKSEKATGLKKKSRLAKKSKTVSLAADGINIELNSPGDSFSQRRKDFKTLARFYGVCVGLLGFFSLLPAIIMLARIQQGDMHAVTPRWIYLMMFVGALHLVYSVYLMQIADWSALWAVSILMLVASCLYGMFSAAIMLDSGFGLMAQFLQLTSSQIRTAGIGCLVGLLLSVLTSYLCGREALNWKRSEQKLFQIAMKRRQQSS